MRRWKERKEVLRKLNKCVEELEDLLPKLEKEVG